MSKDTQRSIDASLAARQGPTVNTQLKIIEALASLTDASGILPNGQHMGEYITAIGTPDTEKIKQLLDGYIHQGQGGGGDGLAKDPTVIFQAPNPPFSRKMEQIKGPPGHTGKHQRGPSKTG